MISKKRKYLNKISINIYIILLTFKEDKKNIKKKIFNILKIFYYYNKYIEEINRFNTLVTIYIS